MTKMLVRTMSRALATAWFGLACLGCSDPEEDASQPTDDVIDPSGQDGGITLDDSSQDSLEPVMDVPAEPGDSEDVILDVDGTLEASEVEMTPDTKWSNDLPDSWCNREIVREPDPKSPGFLIIRIPEVAAPLGCDPDAPKVGTFFDCPSDNLRSEDEVSWPNDGTFSIMERPINVTDYEECEALDKCSNADLSHLPPDAPLTSLGLADVFCFQNGYFLCSELDLERAARGPSALRFPWGNEPASVCRGTHSEEEFLQENDVSEYGVQGLYTKLTCAGNTYCTLGDPIPLEDGTCEEQVDGSWPWVEACRGGVPLPLFTRRRWPDDFDGFGHEFTYRCCHWTVK